MAVRPQKGGPGASSARSSASQPPGRGSGSRAERGGQRSPFGDFAKAPFEGGLFGGRDPFADFGRMDPFGPGLLGGGGGGGGLDSIMKQFDDTSQGAMQGGGAGMRGGGGMMGMGNGQYACQSVSMCSRMGPDGKVHTERFANSEVGNRAHNIREAQQAYSNSSTGTDKMALERQLGDRGRKVVRERNRHTKEEKPTEILRGMDESGRDAFGRDFDAHAHHVPQHPRFNPQALMGAAGTPSGGRAALSDTARRGNSMPHRR